MKFKLTYSLLLLLLAFQYTFAQNNSQNWKTIILAKDSAFWTAFNNCDLDHYKDFLTDNLEFYHDAAGLTNGLDALVSSSKKIICSGSMKLRRAPLPGSYRIYPLKQGNEIYGAVLSGEHLFYKQEAGQKEQPEGYAKFTHVWSFKDNDWKMSRILSYDHGPHPASK